MVGHNVLVDLAGDEPLQAADDVFLRHAFCGSSGDEVDGRLMELLADDHGALGLCVGLAVTAAVWPVLVRQARRSWDRAGAAGIRERGFGADPAGVVAEHDEHLCRAVSAHAVAVRQGG